ncbi:LuxR C-terminal-related transcriptional regulator [Pseudonocardia halophobica]|uniref:LuxR C-terminal-related transcriptional regulator n=1 Tax=Pseudonocardia halophobica TaxID=29401 RepID=UPI003D93804F
MSTVSALSRARASLARRSWGEAYAELARADAAAPLDIDGLEMLALASYLTGRDEEATRAWTRAHHHAMELHEPRRAARQAIRIASGLMFRGETAPARGWFARAGRVLQGHETCAEQAWLHTWDAFTRMWSGDPKGAQPVFTAAAADSGPFDDPDLVTMSRLGEGMCVLLQGAVSRGLVLLDEVMVAVTSGEVSPIYAGMAYCTVIAGCIEVFDLQRARQWTTALARWCDAQPDLVPYRGNCLVHRCELLQLEGAWADAVAAAHRACELLSGPIRWDSLGSAYYQLAELHRLRGEYAAAEKTYRRAGAAGRRPEPGLALLRLAQGRIDAAAAVLHRALAETEEPPARSRLLAAYVDVMIAAGDLAAARAGAEELDRTAEVLDVAYLRAVADSAAGAVLIAEGDARSALRRLRVASATWRRFDAPYEAARAQVLIGLACRALGDPETSAMELDAARNVFAQLGAEPDVERLDGLVGRAVAPIPGGLTARELQVLTLVASGRTNRGIGRELGLSEKTVARHVHNLLTKLDVPSRAAATAYAYEHDLIEHPDTQN